MSLWGVKTDGVKTEEMRVERRGDKHQEKADQWVRAQ